MGLKWQLWLHFSSLCCACKRWAITRWRIGLLKRANKKKVAWSTVGIEADDGKQHWSWDVKITIDKHWSWIQSLGCRWTPYYPVTKGSQPGNTQDGLFLDPQSLIGSGPMSTVLAQLIKLGPVQVFTEYSYTLLYIIFSHYNTTTNYIQ